jgi:tRNA(Arg) A34 adenosine deaminase TadA
VTWHRAYNPGVDETDKTYLRRAVELARQSGEAGEFPFASLLVVDGKIIAEDHHSGRTDHDITAHPELKLARWAARELGRERTPEVTMYTSCEPCQMCSAAIHYAGIGRVVFALSLKQLREISPPSARVKARYEGPALFDEARAPIDTYGS